LIINKPRSCRNAIKVKLAEKTAVLGHAALTLKDLKVQIYAKLEPS
jgi:hypothetical protein